MNKAKPAKLEKSKLEAENSLKNNPNHYHQENINKLEKLKVIINFSSSILIPLVIGIVGFIYSQSIKERETQGKFVEIAVNILSQTPDSTQESQNIREWATQIIDQYSGVKLNKETKRNLIEETSIPSKETIPYQEKFDLNSDGKINDSDKQLFESMFGMNATNPKFSKQFDFNKDDRIDILDMIIFDQYYFRRIQK